MRTESRLVLGSVAADARGAPTAWRRQGDVVAVVLLVTLPAVIFGVPALLGHAVLPGDDLTQNFPLRVLAGREIGDGHLPLFDPYIWSGAPLLAGWNAAAAYPLTWLFAVLPGAGAWTINMIATWAVAGLGMFCFLRALRLASLASFLGAFSFAFAGGMSAQVTHFGLVAGMSWVPVMLLSILRLSQDRRAASRLGWTGVLATATGLVILAGEPRAIDDACAIVVIYAAWQVARLGRRAGSALVSVTAGLALGACLGAIQWLPGLATISSSQRGADSMALYSSGSLPVRWVLLTLVPDLLGGSGSLSQPSFFSFYNLTEVTSYVGILPLVAAFALLGRLGWARGKTEGVRGSRSGSSGTSWRSPEWCSRSAATPPWGICFTTCPCSVISGCRAAISSWWTWRSPSCSVTGPTSPSAGRGAWGVAGPRGAFFPSSPGSPDCPGDRPRRCAAACGGRGGHAGPHLGYGLSALGGDRHQRQRHRPPEAMAASVCGAGRRRGRVRGLRAAPRAEAALAPARRLRRRRPARFHRPLRGRGRARPFRGRRRLQRLRRRLQRLRRRRRRQHRGGPDGDGNGPPAPGRGAWIPGAFRDLRSRPARSERV